jgi:alpha-tubulin suppressor-like RCC1 family protein
MNSINFVQVSARLSHSLALDNRGRVWAWGKNHNGQLGNGRSGEDEKETTPQNISKHFPREIRIIQVSAGREHSLVLDDRGHVWSCGDNEFGELGNGRSGEGEKETTPVNISEHFPREIRIIQVSAGKDNSLALDDRGRVWSWGRNVNGKLGNNSTTNANTPQNISKYFPRGTRIVQVSAGEHSLAVDSDGEVWAWGWNLFGQLGNNESGLGLSKTTPQNISERFNGGATVVQVSNGIYHSLALDDTGDVWSWGHNQYGELGNGDTNRGSRNTPQNISERFPRGTEIIKVSAGWDYSLAVDERGRVWSWGRNVNGQLGNNDINGLTQTTPQNISKHFPGGARIVQISTGIYHSLALDDTGNVWSWGWNKYGQLGNGTITNRNTPQDISRYFISLYDSTFLYTYESFIITNYLPIQIADIIVKRKNRYILPNYTTFTNTYSSILNNLNNQDRDTVSNFLYNKYIGFYKISRNDYETINREINQTEPNVDVLLPVLKKLYKQHNMLDNLYLENHADVLTQITSSATREFENRTHLTLVNIKDKSDDKYDESNLLNQKMTIHAFKILIRNLNNSDIIVNVNIE